ncbi:hypothetical protein EVAR_64697_1 [Eumeta japonica]|uniref:Uncharacterized protein n=1 Tax=Eumeta variegata TaxID=151549 RepID=A0A4C1SVZ7_EUMVA|nr:hypothetical protein EVAR_64697_1 [Eumeta japonica]
MPVVWLTWTYFFTLYIGRPRSLSILIAIVVLFQTLFLVPWDPVLWDPVSLSHLNPKTDPDAKLGPSLEIDISDKVITPLYEIRLRFIPPLARDEHPTKYTFTVINTINGLKPFTSDSASNDQILVQIGSVN